MASSKGKLYNLFALCLHRKKNCLLYNAVFHHPIFDTFFPVHCTTVVLGNYDSGLDEKFTPWLKLSVAQKFPHFLRGKDKKSAIETVLEGRARLCLLYGTR